jgi:hypothetical protein
MMFKLSVLLLIGNPVVFSFAPSSFHRQADRMKQLVVEEAPSWTSHNDPHPEEPKEETTLVDRNRRRSIFQICFTSLGLSISAPEISYAKGKNLDQLQSQLKEARAQLDPVPKLIQEQKWDSVRAILITPPLSDCWSKTGKLLQSYANAIGEELPDGDELAALELKEEALDHLRFLDMAVYNNVFNPIRTEGESGATKELISSYYDDPVREYNACVRVMDDLLSLTK